MDKQVLLVHEGAHWGKIQEYVQNAVVQVFAQVGRFNWLEPYRVQEEGENRGSGFFINDEGYLITSAHVVHEAKHVWVHVPIMGQQPLHAQVVSMCPERDLALVRLQEGDLQQVRSILSAIPFLALGDSDKIRRTDSVLVLGYPLGQYRLKSVTGVISGRELVHGHSLIQITAPINPGSSGGPILNVHGQVIGIAVASIILAQNVGYAIPANELTSILDDMYTNQLLRKPVLGVRFAFASDEQARFFGNPLPSGLYICTVFKGSLFEQAGVCTGDVLYEFNGFRVDAYGDASVPWTTDKTSLYDLISRLKIGDKVQLTVYRNGERVDIQLTYGLGDVNPIRRRYPDFEEVGYEVMGGLVIMELADNHLPLLLDKAPQLVRFHQPENKREPVLVITHVFAGSYAHRLRTLMPGDIIREINGKQVQTLDGLREALGASVKTGFVTLKTNLDVFVVFSLERLLAEEERLSADFVYPMSKTLTQLAKAAGKG